MKKTNYLFGAFGLLALGLASCSDDDLSVKEPQKAEAEETRFITVSICAPSSVSRAFEYGTDEENYVRRLDFLFYDVNGKPTATPRTLSETEIAANVTFTDNESGQNVARIYTSVVPIELAQGQNLPAQVICIVNGNANAVRELQAVDLNDLRDKKQTQFTRDGNFLMTNSVYYGKDVLTGQSEQRLCATPINANTQLFSTKIDAQKALQDGTAATATDAQKAALVDIYVERVAAKVSMTLDNSTIEDYTLVNGDAADDATDEEKVVTLKFVPEYWLMNAVDNHTYLTKRYGVSAANMSPDYNEILAALTTTGGWPVLDWNSEANHRSYWGTSPSYFNNRYPMTSDQVDNLETGNQAEEKTYPTTYYSYTSIVKHLQDPGSEVSKQARAVQKITSGEGETETTFNGWNDSYIYTRETTTPETTINNDNTGNPAATVASAVILGHYMATVGGEAQAQKEFFVDRNVGDNGTYYGSKASALAALFARQSIVFADNQGTTPIENSANFTIEHPKYAVRTLLANPNIAGRLETIQLASVPTEAYYYNAATGTYDRIESRNLNQVNAQLVSTGYMECFYNGLAFFSIPIRHLNWKTNSYTPATANSPAKYNWSTMVVGELGVVRNHVYKLTVNKITGLGNALRSEDQPIVPAKESVNQYIAMRLNILQWNIARTWDVDL